MIVGGVDLLQKAEEQEKLLDESNKELMLRKDQEANLRKQIESKEVGSEFCRHKRFCNNFVVLRRRDSTSRRSTATCGKRRKERLGS